MGFKKSHHKYLMPGLVRYVLREFRYDEVTKDVERSWSLPPPFMNGKEGEVFIGWGLLRSVNFDQIRKIIEVKWPQAGDSSVWSTIDELIAQKFLTKLALDKWKVNRAPIVPKVEKFTGAYRTDRTVPVGKAGECPRCGKKVANKNRHKNDQHTGEECRLERVRQVMEE